ncbi:MAG TPA: glycerol-3-phosphate dehydrogenase/oxidase [Candidatus Omnitrophota bacterium]|nr:glycerol-3-phosphate dehydrogenase/oxidase [Candidatus Omnitrophota bacterium]
MKRDIQRLSQGQYDALVVGGGINGAAIANLAALNGLRVCLLEKGDFASGTSSKSTKLIHGGLRYLENFEFDLVRESLKERFIQLKTAPHLVKPLAFIFTVYKNDARPLWMIQFGIFLYDFLSGPYRIGKHKRLTPTEILQEIPSLKKDDLLGGVVYYDAQMDDARLCLENVLVASKYGAHAANYVEVKSLIREGAKIAGVRAYDFLNKKEFEVRAKKIVCAVGPWTNAFMNKEKGQLHNKVRTTKGVHIIYRGQFSKYALVIPTKSERRIFFIIPWKGNSLIGTTDTDYTGSADEVSVSNEDIDYLLTESRRVFPDVDFSRDNIITTFAGLRPLVMDHGSTFKVSRKHVIEESYSGIIYVTGGKYTTYRKIAEDTVKRLVRGKPVDTEHNFLLYGSGHMDEADDALASRYAVTIETIHYLKDLYGARVLDVLRLVEHDSSLKAPICTCSPAIKAQIVYSRDTEMAQTPEDIFERRLGLGYLDCKTRNCYKEIDIFYKK